MNLIHDRQISAPKNFVSKRVARGIDTKNIGPLAYDISPNSLLIVITPSTSPNVSSHLDIFKVH